MGGLQMKYFVLKPAGSSPYAKASRAAMREYARKIRDANPELATDLDAWEAEERLRHAGFEEHNNEH